MKNNKVFIISEIGVNHNGDMDLARNMIKVSAECGADAVKFQSFITEDLVTESVIQADYQAKNMDQGKSSQFDMLKKLELTADDHKSLKAYAEECQIEFMSSPFDFRSLDLLISLGVKRIKIASGEGQNAPLLLKIGQSNIPSILSTGMGSIQTIEKALSVLAFGYSKQDSKNISWKRIKDYYLTEEAKELLKSKVTILHCTTNYPVEISDINLCAMDTIHDHFLLPVGYSDHSDGTLIPIAAVARGAKIIEKHFTLDRKLPGPDHRASLEPEAFKFMVDSIRDIEVALGNGQKNPTVDELEIKKVACKKIVAKELIKAGSTLSEKNIVPKRAGDAEGYEANDYWDILGTVTNRDIIKDQVITSTMIEKI